MIILLILALLGVVFSWALMGLWGMFFPIAMLVVGFLIGAITEAYSRGHYR